MQQKNKGSNGSKDHQRVISFDPFQITVSGRCLRFLFISPVSAISTSVIFNDSWLWIPKEQKETKKEIFLHATKLRSYARFVSKLRLHPKRFAWIAPVAVPLQRSSDGDHIGMTHMTVWPCQPWSWKVYLALNCTVNASSATNRTGEPQ